MKMVIYVEAGRHKEWIAGRTSSLACGTVFSVSHERDVQGRSYWTVPDRSRRASGKLTYAEAQKALYP